MPRHEPWFRPRRDEDADDELVDWLGRHVNDPPPPKKKTGGGWGCLILIAAGSIATVVETVVRMLTWNR